MRMRKKKHRDERIENCGALVIKEPFPKGRWKEVFGNENKIYLEIGCGKGRFITETAKQNPNINFIAIEKNMDVALLAMEKAYDAGLTNIRFICDNVDRIEEMILSGECSRLYINFCDPWHKYKHAKRRLTHRRYIEIYRNLLPEGGEIHFKTDNKPLFEFSLNEFCDSNVKLKNISLDLHAKPCEWNVMTEYEQLFSEKGMPIYRLEAVFVSTKTEEK